MLFRSLGWKYSSKPRADNVMITLFAFYYYPDLITCYAMFSLVSGFQMQCARAHVSYTIRSFKLISYPSISHPSPSIQDLVLPQRSSRPTNIPTNILAFTSSLLYLLHPLLNILSSDTTLVAHRSEDAACGIKPCWRIQFRNLALVHDYYTVVPDNSAQTMSNAQQRPSVERSGHGTLDLLVCLHVDGGSGFVADDDAGISNQRTS